VLPGNTHFTPFGKTQLKGHELKMKLLVTTALIKDRQKINKAHLINLFPKALLFL